MGTLKRLALTTATVLLLATPAAAQTPIGDLMPITVQPDRVMIKTEFVPRSLTAPRVKAVAAGDPVFEPAADSTFDYFENAGTVRFSRTRNTLLKVQTAINLPVGTLDIGTAADPIPCGVKIEVVFLNVPIDTSKDPAQWGNGLLNFGHRIEYGCKKLEWTVLTGELLAGVNTVTLRDAPAGWVVGDEVVIVATDKLSPQQPPRRESVMTVAGINGSVITLSKGADFDHLAQRNPDGGAVLMPRIANMTRNIVIRSEDPTGTPGHVADVGHGAMWDVRYTRQEGLGRTRAETLNNTVADPIHIGTNQVGRYNEHHHHAMGLGSASVGNVYVGGGPKTGKWAISVHGTHDSLIDRNIADKFLGAGFVTEDGYEVRNVFRQNFGMYNHNPTNYATNPDVALANVQTLNAPGIEGACGWFRGAMNTFDGNECWDNGTGINLFNVAAVPGAYPSVVGGPNDTSFGDALSTSRALPVLVKDNVMASNIKFGLESWGLARFPNVNPVGSFNGQFQFNYVISNPTQVYLVNPTILSKDGTTDCISSSASYTLSLEIEGGSLRGCAVGVIDGGAIQSVKITGTMMQNVLDFQYDAMAVSIIHDGVIHKPMPGHTPQYWYFGRNLVWPGPPQPLDGPPSGNTWYYQRGNKIHVIKNHQGVAGDDYRLIHPQQMADTLAWPTEYLLHQYGTPEAGLTMGAVWNKYGISWGGESVSASDVVALTGLVGPGHAVKGATIPFGPPKATLTYPNSYVPAVISFDSSNAPYIELDGLVTGDPAAASQDFVFSVDGAPAITMQSFPEWEGDQRKYGIRNGMANGAHTVNTWRNTTAGTKIAASNLTFTYTVGTVTPPPPTLCTDPAATNVGQPLPCTFAPPPPTVTYTDVLGVFKRKSINGVPTNEFKFCLPSGECFTWTFTPVQ